MSSESPSGFSPHNVPPHNEEAERALLGALLLDPQRVPEISEIVHLGDFFHGEFLIGHLLVLEFCKELDTNWIARGNHTL